MLIYEHRQFFRFHTKISCSISLNFSWIFAYILLILDLRVSQGLKNVSIEMPIAVIAGETITLKCLFDLEGESLYMVKWYKGTKEFYRYVPKELPNTKVFPLPGVDVDVSSSGPHQVVLRYVRSDLTGKYRCEVSADAPSFHTQVVSTFLYVVYAPDGIPKLMLEKSQYSTGDKLKGNCTSPPSAPSANITWFVNDKQINSSFVRRMKLVHKTPGTDESSVFTTPQLWVTKSGIEFEVNTFQLRELKLVCVADIFHVFTSRTHVVLTEEKPRLASVLYTSRDSASYGSWHTTHYFQFMRMSVIIYISHFVPPFF